MPENEHPSVSLKEYLEMKIREVDERHNLRADLQDKAVAAALVAQQKAVDAALAAQKDAVNKAETQNQHWRENSNEWRNAMNDREGKFASATMLAALEARVQENASHIRTIEAHKEGVGSGWTYLGQFVALAAAVIAIALSLLH